MDKIVEFPGLGLSFSFANGFSVGTFFIAFYGIIIAVGVLLAMVYAFSKFKVVGVNADRAVDCIIGGMIGAIIGARLYFVAFSWDNYKDNLMAIFDVRSGGMAIYGGLIGGILVGALIAKLRKVKLFPLLDVIGISFLIGQAIGRWGNFVNVEAFGSNTKMPWGMTSPDITAYLSEKASYFTSIGVTVDPTMPVHPCFLYESLWCIAGFFLLNAYLKHRKFDGEVFLMYLGYYGLGRFIIEGLRTDSLMIGTLRVSQLLALALFVACTIVIVVIRSKIKGNNDPDYLKLYIDTPEGAEAILDKPKKKDAPVDVVEDTVTTEQVEAEIATQVEADDSQQVEEME